MAAKPSTQKASGTNPAPSGSPLAPPIKAVKLRHPIRWVVAGVIVLYFASFVWDAAVNRPVYDWETFGKYIFDKRISEAALVTLELTVCSMVIAIGLGIALAVMRLSPNPVFQGISWFYLWVFRGTPVYVQLVFWGLIAAIYPIHRLRSSPPAANLRPE
jgi:polar amino acid transport system permease protein